MTQEVDGAPARTAEHPDPDRVEYMTIKDVCKFLGVSKMTLHRWRKLGVFPEPRRVSTRGFVRWLKDDVRAWRPPAS